MAGLKSQDTLGATLELFSSPESGYQADKSSDAGGSGRGKQRALPARYRRVHASKESSEGSGRASEGGRRY